MAFESRGPDVARSDARSPNPGPEDREGLHGRLDEAVHWVAVYGTLLERQEFVMTQLKADSAAGTETERDLLAGVADRYRRRIAHWAEIAHRMASAGG